MKILILAPYPAKEAPSQRFRFEQYLPALTEAGFEIDFQPFIQLTTWQILYKPGHLLQKALGILKGFVSRKIILFKMGKYDYVFIHREVAPLGPPIFEWIIAKILKKKIIYDFDDAIWLANTSENNKIAAAFKWHHKAINI